MINWHLPSLRLFCLLLSGFWQNSTIIWCFQIRSNIVDSVCLYMGHTESLNAIHAALASVKHHNDIENAIILRDMM